MKFLSYVDKFGRPFALNILGESRYKTKFGGIMTIFCYSSVIFLFLLMGKNFYSRDHPSLTNGRKVSSDYFNYTLNHSNFIFAFRIDDQLGNIVDRPEFFYFEPQYIITTKGPNGSSSVTTPLKYHRCTKQDANNNTIYDIVKMNDWYCLDIFNQPGGLTVGGLYDSSLIQYIKIKVWSCATGKIRNPTLYPDVTCSTNTSELTNMFDNYLYFSMIIQNYFVDANNYIDPFQLTFGNLYETLDMKVQKKIYYYFKRGDFFDNDNWVLEDGKKMSVIGMDSKKSDSMMSNKDIFTMTYYDANLYFDKIIENIDRRYMKLQDVIVNIGGILKTLTLFCSIIVNYYNRYYQNFDLINNAFEIDDKYSTITSNHKAIFNNKRITYDKKQENLIKLAIIAKKNSVNTHHENSNITAHSNPNSVVNSNNRFLVRKGLSMSNMNGVKHINTGVITYNLVKMQQESAKNKKLHVSIWKFYRNLACKKISSTSIHSRKINTLKIVSGIMNEKLDVCYLLKFLNYFDDHICDDVKGGISMNSSHVKNDQSMERNAVLGSNMDMSLTHKNQSVNE